MIGNGDMVDMMNWMMDSMYGYGLLGLITWILIIIVLTLLIIYLWKLIQKK